jgi:serine/threonine-protein kinase
LLACDGPSYAASYRQVIGKRVNNFEITRLLGEGGMGAVYEATHSIISQRVAVKVLRREFALNSALVQRFFNEARATHAIRHPNIVEIVDVGMLPEGVPYLIMELLEGESLGHRVGRLGRLELKTALDFSVQVADALQRAHSAGIIHRDIKPDHLFLVDDELEPGREAVKVLDFGIAKLRADLSAGKVTTNAGTILGTPAYMAPEQCRGVAEAVDHRADIYGLGITLYELLCGVPPFVGRGIGDVMMLHMGVEPEPPSRRRPELPPEVDRVVLKALAKPPERRFQSMAEFASALRGCLGGEQPTRAVTSSTPPLVRGRMSGSSTPSNLSVQATSLVQKAGGSRGTALLVIGGLVLVALVGQVVLRSNGSRPMSAREGDAVEQNRLGLRNEGARGAPAATAPAAPPAVAAPAVAAPVAAAPSVVAGVVTAAAPPEAPSAPARPPSVSSARSTRSARAAAAPNSIPAPSASHAQGTQWVGAPQGSGLLSLDSVPWANVYVGERMLGTTPLDRVPLPEGRHELRLDNPELEAWTPYVVQIESGRLVSRFVDWDAKRGPRSGSK